MIRRIDQSFDVRYRYPVLFTRGAFDPANPALAEALGAAGEGPHRLLLVLDDGLLAARPGLPAEIAGYAERHAERLEIVAPPFPVRGGEACKADPAEVGQIHALVERHRLCRQSFVVAIGGGAVLDAAGYAAATAHRGLRLLRMPSTVLAQNDAGIGVKNGINAFGRKNFLGTFAPPFAVISDFDLLGTLPARELRSGIAEAVKVGLIRDAGFFDTLWRHRRRLARFDPQAMQEMIVRCAELHLEHIRSCGDPFEFGSARPLDYGHWCAHKLEELTNGELRHGEAVAIGVALDSLYSYRQGLIAEIELARILGTLEDVGFDLFHWALRWLDVERALSDFQEHLGVLLTLTLLDGIGGKVEVNTIDIPLVRECIDALAERTARRRQKRDEPGDMPSDRDGSGRSVLSRKPRPAS